MLLIDWCRCCVSSAAPLCLARDYHRSLWRFLDCNFWFFFSSSPFFLCVCASAVWIRGMVQWTLACWAAEWSRDGSFGDLFTYQIEYDLTICFRIEFDIKFIFEIVKQKFGIALSVALEVKNSGMVFTSSDEKQNKNAKIGFEIVEPHLNNTLVKIKRRILM